MLSSIFFSGDILLKIGCLAAYEILPVLAGLPDPSGDFLLYSSCLDSPSEPMVVSFGLFTSITVFVLLMESLDDFWPYISSWEGRLLPESLERVLLSDYFEEDLD